MSTLESVRWNEFSSESKQEPKESGHDFERSTQDKRTIRGNDYTQGFCSLRRCAKEPFVDFATTRNRVLQIAGQRAEYQG